MSINEVCLGERLCELKLEVQGGIRWRGGKGFLFRHRPGEAVVKLGGKKHRGAQEVEGSTLGKVGLRGREHRNA